jgi:hypothetical protein
MRLPSFLAFAFVLTSASLATADERYPSFDLHAADRMATGKTVAPYFLQGELYRLEIEAPEPLNETDKKPAQIRIYGADDRLLHTASVTLRHRGSSSLGFPKKQYAMTLASKASLLGMAKAEDYVLSAPYNDKSLLRDVLAYNLANSMGRYAPRTRLAVATLKVGDGPVQPQGIYVLTEKNELADGKVAIPKKNEATGETAFLLQVDRVKADDAGKTVRTQRGVDVIIDYPKKDLTAQNKVDLKAKLDRMEQAFADHRLDDWTNLFDEQVDLSSAVDFFISQELSRNVDAYRLSSPFYIPIGGKIHFGPIWDFNLGFGNADYENGSLVDGWRAVENGVWFSDLAQHPAFCSALQSRWQGLRGEQGVLSNNSIFEVIDRHAAVIAGRVAENFALWGGLGQRLWPNAYWFESYDLEKLALKSWVALRAQWMDAAIAAPHCSVARNEPLARDLTSGGTFTVSNPSSPAAEQAENAFDDQVRTKWLVWSRSVSIAYTFAQGQSRAVNAYAIHSANDFPERDPSAWVLEASRDGEAWVALDQRQGEGFSERFQGRTFSFTNDEAFPMYRLRFLDNHGAGELQLSEIQLFDQR